MGSQIAYTFRRPDLGIDRTTKSDDGLFRFPSISPGWFPRSRNRELGWWPSVSPSRSSPCPLPIAIYMRRPCFEPSGGCAITDGVELPMLESSVEGGSDGYLFTLRRA
jgi:hypothetical protein